MSAGSFRVMSREMKSFTPPGDPDALARGSVDSGGVKKHRRQAMRKSRRHHSVGVLLRSLVRRRLRARVEERFIVAIAGRGRKHVDCAGVDKALELLLEGGLDHVARTAHVHAIEERRVVEPLLRQPRAVANQRSSPSCCAAHRPSVDDIALEQLAVFMNRAARALDRTYERTDGAISCEQILNDSVSDCAGGRHVDKHFAHRRLR